MSTSRTEPGSAGAIRFTPAGLAAATGGLLLHTGTRPILGGAVDTRRIVGGEAFFALAGERTDGHLHLAAAVAAGAAALVVRSLPDGRLPDGAEAVTVVAVDDPLAALGAAAADWRARIAPFVVGITGSFAKTSTKEQVAEVLAEARGVLRSAGNENNEIGLPLTLLRAEPDADVLVLEMGFYREGRDLPLARMARPHVGIVTAVRGVHLERAGSIDAIERGKRELIDALPVGGTAILNADDPRVGAWRPGPGVACLRYGFAPDADVRAEDVASEGADGMRFTLCLPGVRIPAATPCLGRHSVHNALAAAAAGHVLGLEPATIVRGIARGSAAPHRTTLRAVGTRRILDDSYNAAPDTMVAALDLLATLPGPRIAVLGEMLELGAGTEPGHRAAGAHAARTADRLVVVGAAAGAIAEGARAAGMADGAVACVADRAAAADLLRAEAPDGATILVKASRGAALDLLVDALVAAWDGPEARP
ncbi:MAG: UDP-N-acetylmuramoyl-tripeptide--D-alanyl-D-alanine ligase [Chloroflexota bacterium]